MFTLDKILVTAHTLVIAPMAILIGTLAAAAPAEASMVYQINQSGTVAEVGGENSPLSDTISGSITTDGTIGVLQASDVTSFNLTISDNIVSADSVVLTPSNGELVEDVGNGLTASATGLSFNFSDSGAVFLIQGTKFGAFSGYQYFCFQADSGPCAAGETIVPNSFGVDGVLVSSLSGSVPLAPVPLPATLPLFCIGLAGLALVRQYEGTRRADFIPSAA